MSKTFRFVEPREQALAKFKNFFINMEIEWMEEQTVNNGYGQKIKAEYQESPFSVVIYFNKKNYSSKIVLEKGTEELEQVLVQKLGEGIGNRKVKQVQIHKPLVPSLEPSPGLLIAEAHIGTDESGKGDYFGPLVIAGAFVGPDEVAMLQEMGVADSKTISDFKIKEIASKLRLSLKNRCNLVFINPEKYNELYAKMKNLNKLLAWGHARVIENLLQNVNSNYAIADKFGNEKYIQDALMKKGRQIKLIQIPRAEQDLAVAVASVLARDVFLNKLEELSRQYDVIIPKGCNEKVKDVGRQIIARYGQEEIGKIAKLHFKTTEEIISKK